MMSELTAADVGYGSGAESRKAGCHIRVGIPDFPGEDPLVVSELPSTVTASRLCVCCGISTALRVWVSSPLFWPSL